MITTGLEEHVAVREVLDAQLALPPRLQDLALGPSTQGETGRRLLDVGEDRLAAMAATGLDIQVLSLAPPGLQALPAGEAVDLQRRVNDFLAQTVAERPDHFGGLAALATGAPDQAAAELDRAVRELRLDGAMIYGRSGSTNMDSPDYWPLYEAAEALGAPLHLHPQSPPAPVREAYYTGLGTGLDAGFATMGLGWHVETGVQLVRMMLAGVFDRFPKLQVIVGHWGEVVLFYLDRLQQLATRAHLPVPLAHYLRNNLWVAPSGMLSHRYLRWTTELVGVDRILFSTDYPYESASLHGARAFLDAADLTTTDREAVAHDNWQRLRSGIRR